MARVAKRKDPYGRVLPDGVSYRNSDNRYIYRYQLYGKTHYLYDRDLNELKKKIMQLQLDVASGRNTDIAKMSLNEWYPQYLRIFKVGKVKDTTLMNMKNYYKWYIEEYAIAKMPMKDLKRTHIVAHFNYLADKKNLAYGTLRSVASMLYNAIQQVVYDSGLFVNPASEIMKDVVAAPKEVREALTDEQINLLLEFLKIEGSFQNTYLPMIGILLGTGMRFGECDGLTWGDIDFDKKVIHVNHGINYRSKGGKHEFFMSSPKTPNAIRDIPLSEDLIKLLMIQKQYQKNMKIRNDIEIDGYKNFVFTTKLGFPYTHEGFVKSLRRIVKHANEWERERAEAANRKPVELPENLTPHVFRHTFCTALVIKNVPYETMKVVLGHSSIKTSLDIYSHIQGHLNRVRTDIGDVVKIF